MTSARILPVLAASLCVAATAQAAGKVSLSIGQAEFEGLQVDGLVVDWTPGEGSAGAVRLRTARIRGIGATGPLSGFALDCPELQVAGNRLECPRGRLSGALGSLGRQDTRFSARSGDDGRLYLKLETVSLASGRARVDLVLDGADWRLDSEFAGSDIAGLAVLAEPWLPLPEGFTVAGSAGGQVNATGRGDSIRTADADIGIARLDFADAEGLLAAEGLTGSLRARLTAAPRGFDVAGGRLELTGGQAYSDPVFLDFGAHRASVDFAGLLDTDAVQFEAGEFALDHDGVLQAGGSASLDLDGDTLLTDASLKIAELDLASALPAYVQPFLVATALKGLSGAGRVSGELDIAAGLPARAALDIADAQLDSQTGSLSVQGLRGRLHWFDDATRSALAGEIDDALFQSQLAWDSASLWGIDIGAVDLPFAAAGRHFRLLEPRLLPIFDGGLAIGTLRVRHAGTEEMYVRFDAELRPISVARLSRALGWPEFQGTLSGAIPGLQLAQGVVTLDGELQAAVFDGEVVVRDLSLQNPLGKFPRLRAGIEARNLDLAQVTSTFSFGMITGRLSGSVQDLEMFDWMPVSFDARFATPPGDRSKHRISQRAVTNLSSIGGGSGGGVAAALQGGFLKFFDTFGYDRLGLSCRLENDVCTMGGVLSRNGSYYIVKGAGLPRIDVIGSQKRVAWTRLVSQLAAIMESEIVVE